MTAKNKFKSPAFEAIHSAASGLFSVGAIPQETMRDFDKASLSHVEDLQPTEIKALREKLNVSQPVFARYLNTSVKLGEGRYTTWWDVIKTTQHRAKTWPGRSDVISHCQIATRFVDLRTVTPSGMTINATNARHLRAGKRRYSAFETH